MTWKTVREASRQGIPSLRQTWRFICDEIDYVPVFALAAEILAVLEDGPADVRTPVILPLVKAVSETRNVEGPRPRWTALPHPLVRRQVHRRVLYLRARSYVADTVGLSQLAGGC